MTRLLVLILMFLACSCTTLRTIEKEKVTIRTDTIVRTDTIESKVIIPGEERVVYFDRIDTMWLTKYIPEIEMGTFTLDTMWVRSVHARAWFGIKNNRPFMGITQDPIELVIQSYIQRITILEQQLKEREKVTVRRYRFYENPWFWAWTGTIGLIAGLCCVSRKKGV